MLAGGWAGRRESGAVFQLLFACRVAGAFVPTGCCAVVPARPAHFFCMNLPDIQRTPLPEAKLPASRRLGNHALKATWHLLRPAIKEPFSLSPPHSLPRHYYCSSDGWQAPLYRVDPIPGATGEPVLLAHGMGGSALDFALEPEASLAGTLSRAGYTVWLLEHRADRSAISPNNPAAFTADDIAIRDLDGAIRMIQEFSRFSKILVVGHGLGAQLLYLRQALVGHDDLVAGVYLGGASRFKRETSGLKMAGTIAQMLPPHWVLPGRRVQQLLATMVGETGEWGNPQTPGPVLRGRLCHGGGDLHAALLRQVGKWLELGWLSDATGGIEVASALKPFPSLVVEAEEDTLCPPGAAEPVMEALRSYRLRVGGGHWDLLLGERAQEAVFGPMLQFLEVWRRRCW